MIEKVVQHDLLSEYQYNSLCNVVINNLWAQMFVSIGTLLRKNAVILRRKRSSAFVFVAQVLLFCFVMV